jgi:protein ImuB
MSRRFVTIWFPHLKTDWLTIRKPALSKIPFVLSLPQHGKMVISAANDIAQKQGIPVGMALADARALFPSLQFLNDKQDPSGKLLNDMALYCIRYTPVVATDIPDGLILDVSGCAHLWGGETEYITVIINRFRSLGYHVRAAMADTIGSAWAIARFGKNGSVVEPGKQGAALLSLPPVALRIDPEIADLLSKLGLSQIENLMSIPRSALRRRFGEQLLQRLNQALGTEEEFIFPVKTPSLYEERLPCLETIITATGIEIALRRLLESLCKKLFQKGKGLRSACFSCFRIDGITEQITIGTNRASHHVFHLFKLFELKIETIKPGPGIELFTLEVLKAEDALQVQEKLWSGSCGLDDIKFAELLDRIAGKVGERNICRYLPDEHYWPERSFKSASSINEKSSAKWSEEKLRPIHLLTEPEIIQVTAPVPDYPPMYFRYKGKLHTIRKADGPERIEPEWWIKEGEHRDYYSVEDENGCRYWLFRLGHYTGDKRNQWFIHGFFA